MFEFKDNRAIHKANMNAKIHKHVLEVKDLLASQGARNTKRVSGLLAKSITDDSRCEFKKYEAIAYIGSSVSYAPYYELGTGEYALQGKGRKGGWVYYDKRKEKYVFTKGQTPKRPLYRAYIQKRTSIKKRAEEVLHD